MEERLDEPFSDAPGHSYVTHAQLEKLVRRRLDMMVSRAVQLSISASVRSAVKAALEPIATKVDAMNTELGTQKIRREAEESAMLKMRAEEEHRAKMDSQNSEAELNRAQLERLRQQTPMQPLPVPPAHVVVAPTPPLDHSIDGAFKRKIAVWTLVVTVLVALIAAVGGAINSQAHGAGHAPKIEVEPHP